MSLEVHSMAEGGNKRTDWLWDGRIALGTITTLAGQEGHGKTLALCKLAAEASRGDLAGDLYREPCSVAWMSAEDDETRTLNPRLTAAGADPNRIHHFAGDIVIPGSIEQMTGPCRELGVKLLFIDPINGFLDGETQSNNDHSIQPPSAARGLGRAQRDRRGDRAAYE